MDAFEQAWAMLKMPVEDTDVPGLRVVYGTDDEARATRAIGNKPYAHSLNSQIVPMSPNEYFDYVATNSGGMFSNMPPLPDRDAKWRWLGRQLGGRQNVRRIMEGIEEGMPIGAPELGFEGDEFTGLQEGGHRMEALRQMGHGDTRIPVAVHQRERGHRIKGMPEGRELPE